MALVFAELSARMPLTEYSYQWVTRLAGPALGWMTGRIAVCFLIVVVPSVDHAIASVLDHMFQIESPLTLELIAGVANIDNLQAILASDRPLPEIIESRLGTAASSLFFVLILIVTRSLLWIWSGLQEHRRAQLRARES